MMHVQKLSGSSMGVGNSDILLISLEQKLCDELFSAQLNILLLLVKQPQSSSWLFRRNGAWWIFCFVSIIQRTLTWTAGSLTCEQKLRHAIAHDCAWTPWESLHWKLALQEKVIAALGNRTCVGSVPVRCSTNWATPHPTHFAFTRLVLFIVTKLGEIAFSII